MSRAWGVLAVLLLAGCLAQPAAPPSGGHASEPTELVWALRPSLRVDLLVAPGISPAQVALDALLLNLQNETEYPDIQWGQTIVLPSNEGREWTSQDLDVLVARSREAPTPADTTVLQVFFLDGSYPREGGGASLMGVEIDGALILFSDTFDQEEPISQATGDADDRLERAVLVHELGHALGLVGNGAPLTRDRIDREDACRCHSTNRASVMAVGVETQELALNYLAVSEMPWHFDDDDRADLAALRAIPHGAVLARR